MAKSNAFQRRLVWYLRGSIVIAAILEVLFGQWEMFFISLLALVLTFLPDAIERQFKVVLPIEFDLVLIIFIYASTFLGAVVDAYARFWWWDAVLHTSSGFILAYAAFLLFYILYKQGKLVPSTWLTGILVFSIGLAFGAVWEIFEFAMDNLFGLNMQKSGLVDTMWDLIVDALGALVMAYIAGRYIERGGIGPIRRATKNFVRENSHIFRR